MVTHRLMRADDYPLLLSSLEQDAYHTATTPMFFVESETITLVYEDNAGPVMFVRGKGIIEEGKQNLWLSIQYVSNYDGKRNIRAMLEGFLPLVEKAKTNGFREIRFNSYAPLLRKFAITRLGFTEADGETLRYKVQ